MGTVFNCLFIDLLAYHINYQINFAQMISRFVLNFTLFTVFNLY